MESDLVKYGRRNQSALLIHEPNLDMPRPLREALNLRWLISAVGKKDQVSLRLQVTNRGLWEGMEVGGGCIVVVAPLRLVRIAMPKSCKQDPSNQNSERLL
jgi:hypothetical protein